MTKEEKFVVNPLEKYFLNPKRSGAKWTVKDRSRGRSETGWDLQVERKNKVLLIEAKYIRGPFASAFAGLVISPLTNRPEKMKRDLYRSRYAIVCWAIGSGYKLHHRYKMRNLYQILFDFIARNSEFWRAYSKILNVKYIFFVKNGKIAEVNFSKIIDLAERYSAGKSRPERRMMAEKLIVKYLDFT